LAVAGKNKRRFNNGFACTPGKDWQVISATTP
jgi:hypothetical protein